MKKLLNKLTAVTSVCVLALCNTAIPVSADDVAVEDITITFDYSGDGVEVTDDYKDLLQPITISSTSAITIPSAFPTREGYFFSGWTYDGIHAYTYGDTFRSPDGNDVTLTPIWGVKNQEVKYTLKYEVEQNGEIIDTSKELPDNELFAGQIVQVSLMSYTYGDFVQLGWEYDGFEFKTAIFAFLIGIVCAVIGTVGDLSASMVKRQIGFKDYGKIMPGHGGLMDRFDSILFVLPTFYAFVTLL